MPSVFIATPLHYLSCSSEGLFKAKACLLILGCILFLLKKARDFVSGSGNRSPGALHKQRWAGRGTPKAFASGAAAAPLKHIEMLVRPKLLHQVWGEEAKELSPGQLTKICQAGDFSHVDHIECP